MTKLTLSALAKTWLIDVDGTMVKHNGHLSGEDILLDGVLDFFSKISDDDKIILLTSRNSSYKKTLQKFLKKHKIKYHDIIFDLPVGERILVNDKKDSGLRTAYSVNKTRDKKLKIHYKIDHKL